MTFDTTHGKVGAYVDLSFVMNTLMILTTAPHPLDPKATYSPGGINLELSETLPEADAQCVKIVENTRAMLNTQHFYCGSHHA